MVDEPVYTGPVGSQRENTASRRPHLVEGLASARQRGRAAFGTDTPTDLDRNGQRRSRQIFIPLVILGNYPGYCGPGNSATASLHKPANDTATPTSWRLPSRLPLRRPAVRSYQYPGK